jgi:transposase
MMELTQNQWELLEPLLQDSIPPKQVSGRPRRHDRETTNGILWVCRTGAPWKDMPSRYPPYQTCHRRFQEWVDTGTRSEVLAALAADLKRRGKIDISECFIDGSFASAKKGALVLEKRSGERVQRSWQSKTAMVFQSPFAHMKPDAMKLTLLRKHYRQVLSAQNQNE